MPSCEDNEKPEGIEKILVKVGMGLDFPEDNLQTSESEDKRVFSSWFKTGSDRRLYFKVYNAEDKELDRVDVSHDIKKEKFLKEWFCAKLSKFLVNRGYCRADLREGTIKIEKCLNVLLENIDNSIVFDGRLLPKKPLRDVYQQVGDSTYIFFGRYFNLAFGYEGGGPKDVYVSTGGVGGSTLDFDIEYLEGCMKNASLLREDLAKDIKEFIGHCLEDSKKLKSGLEELFGANGGKIKNVS